MERAAAIIARRELAEARGAIVAAIAGSATRRRDPNGRTVCRLDLSGERGSRESGADAGGNSVWRRNAGGCGALVAGRYGAVGGAHSGELRAVRSRRARQLE